MRERRFGKYRVDRLIARGGMAEVYRASAVEGAGFERPVCLKMVRPELADDGEFVSMFEREARIAIALRHPNIVQVFDFERGGGRPFLAMELVEGLDLREILGRAGDLGLRVPVGFALHAAEGLLAALSHAHGHAVDGEPRPIIHRDVSPHNLLVSTSGRVKLADFGIAKARGASSATRTGVVKGKLAYLSPEQAGGGEAGARSDLFCAGLVLFELLAGRRMYAGKSDQEVLAQAMRPKVPELPSLSPALVRFLSRLLAADPADRFTDAAAALAELAPLRREEPYTDADAARLVRALLAARAEGPRDADGGPTRTSRSDLGLRGAPRIGRARAIAGIAIAAAALVAGFGLGALLGPDASRSGPDASRSGPPAQLRSVPSGGPAAPIAAPAAPIVALDAPDAGEAATPPEAPEPEVAAVRAAPVRPGRPARGPGWLRVDCRPWADVTVDGRPVGTTPIGKLRLEPGAHRVVLTNPELGYREEVTARIAPGETAHVIRNAPRGSRGKGGPS